VSLGGPFVVDGLVFFAANVFEHKLHAYSLRDGSEVWQTDLPYSAESVPGTLGVVCENAVSGHYIFLDY
jgi:glucose dehydrogenase